MHSVHNAAFFEMQLYNALAETGCPSLTPMWMRYASTRRGAICGSQVLSILVVMDREVSAPYLARPSTQVTVPK